MPDIIFFLYPDIFTIYFLNMCIYTVKKQKLKKKSLRGVRNSTERSKIRRFRCKGYCKNLHFIQSLYVYFGNTVHIKNVQIMHKSCKLMLKNDTK